MGPGKSVETIEVAFSQNVQYVRAMITTGKTMDLQRLGHSKWLLARPNQKTGTSCALKPQAAPEEDDPDIIHFDNSSDLPLSTSLNDLDNATLHIDGQSTEVDAPPDIIDVVDQDDDITDDEDALPHDLADSDDEDLINVDDDGVDKMSADVARSHGGDGGGEDRPPPHHVPSGCMGCFPNRGKNFWIIEKANESPIWAAGQRTRPEDITGSRSLARLRDEMRQRAQALRSTRRSLTPSSRHTLLMGNSFGMRTDEEMRRLEDTGTYTDDEINRLAKRGKQRGHIPSVGRVLPAWATAGPSTPASESTVNSLQKKVDFMMSLFKSDSKYSDMFSQFESGGASRSGGCGDDEESADAQEDEDEDGDGDS
ncbi:hypothetical protein Tco_0099588 [Tanacetum coccineum]